MAHTQLSTSTKVSVGIAAVALVGLGAYGFAFLLSDDSALHTDTPRSSPRQVILDSCLNKCVDTSNACLRNPLMKAEACALQQTGCETACRAEFAAAGADASTVPPVVPPVPAPRVYAIQTDYMPPAWVNKSYALPLEITGVPAGAALHWSLDSGRLPDGVKLGDLDGMIAGIPLESGLFAFRIKAESTEGSGKRELTLFVNPDTSVVPRTTTILPTTIPTTLILPPTTPPAASVVITTESSLPEARIGRSYRLVFGTGALPFPGASVSWRLESGRFPEGVKLSELGVLAGIPTEVGRFSVRVRADNGSSYGIKEMVFTVLADETIAPPISPPPVPPVEGRQLITITNSSLPETMVGQSYRVQMNYASLPFPSGGAQWSVVEGRLPDGIRLGDRDGVLAGISSEAGNFHIKIRVDNTWNARGEREFDLFSHPPATVVPPVVPPPVVPPPVVTPPIQPVTPSTGPTSLQVSPDVLPVGMVSQSYSQRLSIVTNLPLVWRLVAGTLPHGISFDETSGVLSGTPTEVGQTLLSFRGSDSRNAASETIYGARQYVLTVEAGRPALAITASAIFPDGVIGLDYQHQPLAISGGSQPYVWRIESGRLPHGLSLNQVNGIVSGRPEEAGEFALRIRVADAAQASVSKDFALRVSPAAVVTTKVTGDPANPPMTTPVIQFTPFILASMNALPSGTVGDSYSFHPMNVSGGRAPYQWMVPSQNGQLPSGLHLDGDGTIVGVPTAAQSSSFVLRVQDADQQTISGTFSVTINARPQYSPAYTNDRQWPVRINLINDMGLRVHDLIKLVDDGDPDTQYDTTVYYVGADGRRHAFPNQKVYFSWFSDYANVRIILPRQIANIPLGANITYRPGVRLVKFVTDPRVYAVDTQRRLRWVTTEQAAQDLYGSYWNQNVEDISDAFYMDYRFDAPPITYRGQFDADAARRSVGYPSDVLP